MNNELERAKAVMASLNSTITELRAALTTISTTNDRLKVAIMKHRDQRGDDRCHLDDLELYAVLGPVIPGTGDLPPREEFLNNCARFYECRRSGQVYQSNEKAKAALLDLMEREKLVALPPVSTPAIVKGPPEWMVFADFAVDARFHENNIIGSGATLEAALTLAECAIEDTKGVE